MTPKDFLSPKRIEYLALITEGIFKSFEQLNLNNMEVEIVVSAIQETYKEYKEELLE